MYKKDLALNYQQWYPSIAMLPGPLWPGVVAPDKVLSMG